MDGLKHKGMILNKGQYVRSFRKLADDLSYKEGRGFKKYSLNTIKRCVQKLVENERITTEETELGTLFTVINYQDYQNDSKHFNALNRLESENEERTEVRTPTKEGNSSSSKGFNGVVTESKNSINEELRTNGELMENEVRTLGEQDQELKNLRIKELKESTTTTTSESPFRIFESEGFGTISSVVADKLGGFIDDFGERWVCEAMKEAAYHSKRSLPYVKAILDRWQTSGVDEPWKVDKKEENDLNRFVKNRQSNKPKLAPIQEDDNETVSQSEYQKILEKAKMIESYHAEVRS